MKQLITPRPVLFIMTGYPGAGKTWFAQQLSDAYQLPHINSDLIRHELLGDPTRSEEEEDVVNRLSLYMAKELFKTNSSFIYDGDASRKIQRLELMKLARKAGYQPLIVWTQTDVETALARSKSTHPETPHRVALTQDAFDKLARKFSAPQNQEVEKYVVISGKHTYGTQSQAVITKVNTLFFQPQQLAMAKRQSKGNIDVRTVEPTKQPVVRPRMQNIQRPHIDIARPINIRTHDDPDNS
jgi:predicted kinase